MPVSVGVIGTVNGRSASSPTGNSAVNTSSFPTKGNKEKTKANSSRGQKSIQDLSQLNQKNIQKTKEKVSSVFAQALEYNTCMETHYAVFLFLALFHMLYLINKCGLLLLFRNPTKYH